MWTLYKGTFKTGPNAKRAALGLQLWWNTKYGPQKFKVGDYILFDNVKVEEEKNKIDVPAPAAGKPEAKTVKAAKTSLVASAPVIDGILDEAVWADASEIKDYLTEKHADLIASGNKGQIMKTIMPELKGKADGKVINQVVAELCK